MDIKDLEASIVRAIKASTKEVFSTMLMLDVNADESFIKDENKISTDLISSLHFFGEKYMGKIAVFAYGATACHLAGAMLGIEATDVDEDVKDGMGEIVNMIAGSAKGKLESTMGDFHLLTPWVIAGKNLTIASPAEGESGLSIESQAQFSWIMTKFSYDKGHFIVGVQPNEVPQSSTIESNSEKKINELQAAKMHLENEIVSLKSIISQNNLAV
ncbi:MAG: chemotaxis protein CheX [Candidatus Scalindua sp.]